MLAEASVRIVCLAALLLLPMRLARVKSAAAWHAAYTVLMVAMLAMPLVTQWLPALPVPILEAATPQAVAPAPPAFEAVPVPVVPTPGVAQSAPPPSPPPATEPRVRVPAPTSLLSGLASVLHPARTRLGTHP